jgi:hypothetical protein
LQNPSDKSTPLSVNLAAADTAALHVPLLVGRQRAVQPDRDDDGGAQAQHGQHRLQVEAGRADEEEEHQDVLALHCVGGVVGRGTPEQSCPA